MGSFFSISFSYCSKKLLKNMTEDRYRGRRGRRYLDDKNLTTLKSNHRIYMYVNFHGDAEKKNRK